MKKTTTVYGLFFSINFSLPIIFRLFFQDSHLSSTTYCSGTLFFRQLISSTSLINNKSTTVFLLLADISHIQEGFPWRNFSKAK